MLEEIIDNTAEGVYGGESYVLTWRTVDSKLPITMGSAFPLR
jgi:hypothetical protein